MKISISQNESEFRVNRSSKYHNDFACFVSLSSAYYLERFGAILSRDIFALSPPRSDKMHNTEFHSDNNTIENIFIVSHL